MPNTLAKILILVITAIFILWNWIFLQHALAGHPQRNDMMKYVLMPALIMTLALAINAIAFTGILYTDWMITTQEMAYQPDGTIAPNASKCTLLMKQLSILVGTTSLMFIVRRAILVDYSNIEESPKILGLKIQADMYKWLMLRHWWAVLGIGTVFGIMVGPGIALFLAVELTFMWFACVVGLKILR